MTSLRERYKELFGVDPENDPELNKEHDFRCVVCGRDVREMPMYSPPAHLAVDPRTNHANKTVCGLCYKVGTS